MISHVIIDSCCGIIQVTYKSQLEPERPTFDLKDLRLNRNDRPVSATLSCRSNMQDPLSRNNRSTEVQNTMQLSSKISIWDP